MPLLVGTWSPGLARFAGTAASELKVGGSANPAVVQVMRERIGNDDVGIVLGAVTVVDEDGDRARALARREVAMYVDIVAPYDPTMELEPELLRRIRELVAQGEDDAAGALLAGRPVQAFRLRRHAGRGGRHRPRRSSTQARSASTSAHRTASTETRGIELLCRDVLPSLDSVECSTTRNGAAVWQSAWRPKASTRCSSRRPPTSNT